jgi:hypothetical protein
MEKPDFYLEILELTNEYAYAIMGGLSFGWHCVAKMKENKVEDAEWVQAQLLGLIKDCEGLKVNFK